MNSASSGSELTNPSKTVSNTVSTEQVTNECKKIEKIIFVNEKVSIKYLIKSTKLNSHRNWIFYCLKSIVFSI